MTFQKAPRGVCACPLRQEKEKKLSRARLQPFQLLDKRMFCMMMMPQKKLLCQVVIYKKPRFCSTLKADVLSFVLPCLQTILRTFPHCPPVKSSQVTKDNKRPTQRQNSNGKENSITFFNGKSHPLLYTTNCILSPFFGSPLHTTYSIQHTTTRHVCLQRLLHRMREDLYESRCLLFG